MAWVFLLITFKVLVLLFQLDYKFIQNGEHHGVNEVSVQWMKKVTAQ